MTEDISVCIYKTVAFSPQLQYSMSVLLKEDRINIQNVLTERECKKTFSVKCIYMNIGILVLK